MREGRDRETTRARLFLVCRHRARPSGRSMRGGQRALVPAHAWVGQAPGVRLHAHTHALSQKSLVPFPPPLLPSLSLLSQDTVERRPRLPDGTLAAAAAESATASAAPATSKDRKAGRLGSSLKPQLLATMAPVKLKTMALGVVATIYLVKLSGRAAGRAVAVLPFQATAPPLSWLARRGLGPEDGLTACAAALLFALVQAGVRPAVARLLDAGPTAKMNELQVAFTPGLAAAAAAGERAAAGGGGGGGGGGGQVRKRQ